MAFRLMTIRPDGHWQLAASCTSPPRSALVTREGDWVLVATSCVEAGVELDFRTGLRERCSIASFIQTSGRVNRHGHHEGAVLYDFSLTIGDPLLTEHPAFTASRWVFGRLWPQLEEGTPPSELATRAMALEIAERGGLDEALTEAEGSVDYPEVARLGRVIDADTRTIVVDERLMRLLRAGRRPSSRLIQSRSVQLWAKKIQALGLHRINDTDIFGWGNTYDPLFLGIMSGVLQEITVGGWVV